MRSLQLCQPLKKRSSSKARLRLTRNRTNTFNDGAELAVGYQGPHLVVAGGQQQSLRLRGVRGLEGKYCTSREQAFGIASEGLSGSIGGAMRRGAAAARHLPVSRACACTAPERLVHGNLFKVDDSKDNKQLQTHFVAFFWFCLL